MKNKGQSLLEVVFSIGLIMLVMTGVVILLLNTINARTKSYDRNKAVELSQIVMENIVKTEASDATNFWDLNSPFWSVLANDPLETNTNFPDYTYKATVAQYSGNGCSATKVECVNVIITINWKNGNINNQFNRFFSKK